MEFVSNKVAYDFLYYLDVSHLLLSGPKRYQFVENDWICTKDGIPLLQTLRDELLLVSNIDLFEKGEGAVKS